MPTRLDKYCPCGECGVDPKRWSAACRREAGIRIPAAGQRVEAITADADGKNPETWPTTWGAWRRANANDGTLVREVERALILHGGWAGGGGAQPRFGLRIIGPWPLRYTGGR